MNNVFYDVVGLYCCVCQL